jgi:hypothetical protein
LAVSAGLWGNAAFVGDPCRSAAVQGDSVCNPVIPASLVAEVKLSAAPQGRTARLILDLGDTDAQAAAVVGDLADGMLSQIQTLLANRSTDLPAHLRGALTGLADTLAEQSAGEATVTALDTPLTRAWRAHPAGRGR